MVVFDQSDYQNLVLIVSNKNNRVYLDILTFWSKWS